MVLTGYVYKITNITTGDFYIGQTHSLKRRYCTHSTNKTGCLYKYFQEVGKDNMKLESIMTIQSETVEDLDDKLNEFEVYYIDKLKPTYNSKKGGGYDRTVSRASYFNSDRNPGKNKTEETCKKLSESCRGKIIPEETRLKTSETMKGVPKSEETRKRMSEARTGFVMPKGSDSKKAIKVDQLCKKSKEFIKTFGSIAEAATEVGIQRSGIVMCCKGRLESSGGFSWVYTADSGEEMSNLFKESLLLSGSNLIPEILGPCPSRLA